jgi:DNA-binding NarL/FixJ family response regulator
MRTCYLCGAVLPSLDVRLCQRCRKPKAELNPELSLRECQVVACVQKAMCNKEIAYELRITEGTVKEYLFRITRKLNLANRVALAVWETERMMRERLMREPRNLPIAA